MYICLIEPNNFIMQISNINLQYVTDKKELSRRGDGRQRMMKNHVIRELFRFVVMLNGLNWLDIEFIHLILQCQFRRPNNSEFRECFCSENESQRHNITVGRCLYPRGKQLWLRLDSFMVTVTIRVLERCLFSAYICVWKRSASCNCHLEQKRLSNYFCVLWVTTYCVATDCVATDCVATVCVATVCVATVYRFSRTLFNRRRWNSSEPIPWRTVLQSGPG